MKIALIGLPGSGKTTIGRTLSAHFGTEWRDVDDDILETAWGCTISEKLKELGDEKFLAAEDDALCDASYPEEGILSLTGSNPLCGRAMARLKEAGWMFIWLDVSREDVLERLEMMKVDRIVGQSSGSLKSVLEYRTQFYQKWFDLRILCGRGWDLSQIEEEVLARLNWFMNPDLGKFVSTRIGKIPGKLFKLEDALLSGLAPRGGLFMPSEPLTSFSLPQLARLSQLPYQERAKLVLEKLIHPADIPPSTINSIVEAAYSTFYDEKVVPVKPIEDGLFLAELFHGPSGSFKDLALQVTPQLVVNFLKTRNERSLILVATSGDTGSAVLEGFGRFGGDKVAVLVMFPTLGISSIQRQQMTSFKKDNVKVVAVEGDFDDCQNLVKKMFQQESLASFLKDSYNVLLNTANSINWGRLIPQIVYHFHTYMELVDAKEIELGAKVDLCVPSGNFGNILSGLLAKKLGVPYNDMVVASNENNILADFFRTGKYDLRKRSLKQTISPAIDILVSSNLERWLFLQLGAEKVAALYEKLKEERYFELSEDEMKLVTSGCMSAGWSGEDECKEEITQTMNKSGYVLDPHTSVGLVVGRRFRTENPMVVMSTAHYSKFWSDVQDCIDKQESDITNPPKHLGIQDCLTKEVVHKEEIQPNLEDLILLIKQFVTTTFTKSL